MGQTILDTVILTTRGVKLASGDVQITSQNHPLSYPIKFPDSRIQSSQERTPIIISEAIAVGGTVNAEQDECRELKNHAAPFSIESQWIYTKIDDFGMGEVAANCIFFR